MLEDVLYHNAFSNDALFSFFRLHPALSDRDRRFAGYLLRSVLRNLLSLEAVITHFSSVSIRKMKPRIRAILLLGSCELLKLSSPSYAVIHEYVQLAKRKGFAGLSGFVNAVLRKISEGGAEVLLLQKGALHESLPEALYEDIIRWYGEEAAGKIFAWFQKEEPDGLWIRRNRSRISDALLREALLQEGMELLETPYGEDVYCLKHTGDLSASPAFRKGYFTVQDLSSALAGEIVKDLFIPERRRFSVLDACASPGGKTMHIADLIEAGMPDADIRFDSCDVSEEKVRRIRENLDRCGFSFVTPGVQDASMGKEALSGCYDLVLLDVPCSGIGVIGKRPEIRFHADASERASLVSLQRQILEVNAGYVKPGGTLVYSTCTISPEENLLQVRAFLETHDDFRLQGFRDQLPGALREAEGPASGYFQILPGAYGSDGFFMARLCKQGSAV